jgi:hypothetical protein
MIIIEEEVYHTRVQGLLLILVIGIQPAHLSGKNAKISNSNDHPIADGQGGD